MARTLAGEPPVAPDGPTTLENWEAGRVQEPKDEPTPHPGPVAALFAAPRALVGAIRSRIFSGLLLALPIALTFWIIYQLFAALQGVLLDPLALLFNRFVFRNQTIDGLPFWWVRVVSPLIAIGAVLVFLYFLGYLVRSRVAQVVDWVMLRLPIVTIVYKAVRNVVAALANQGHARRPQRVVLVPFPHPGSKALAYVTKSIRDADTQRTILCVCVLTGVLPPAGFTLFVPEEEVVDVDWTVNEMLQAILSGGITAPDLIRYHTGGPTRLIVPGRGAGEEPGSATTA